MFYILVPAGQAEICGYKSTTQGTHAMMKTVCILAVVIDAQATHVIKVCRTKHTHTGVPGKHNQTSGLYQCQYPDFDIAW